jgi:hypothetical protein
MIAPGEVFDEVLSVIGAGIAIVLDLLSGAATMLPTNAVNISGNNLNVAIPAELLPSQGFAPRCVAYGSIRPIFITGQQQLLSRRCRPIMASRLWG